VIFFVVMSTRVTSVVVATVELRVFNAIGIGNWWSNCFRVSRNTYRGINVRLGYSRVHCARSYLDVRYPRVPG